jgi:hypothetical protein
VAEAVVAEEAAESHTMEEAVEAVVVAVEAQLKNVEKIRII